MFEALQLRVKDIDFSRSELLLRDGKGQKDRVTMLPAKVQPALRQHLEMVRRQHDWDLARGLGRAPLPAALARKYPNADRQWGWQWVFPAPNHYIDRETRIQHRFHLHETTVQKAVRESARKADICKHVTPHVFRHSFATHLLMDNYDIRTVQERFGRKAVRTTNYTHVFNRGGRGARSPLDRPSDRDIPERWARHVGCKPWSVIVFRLGWGCGSRRDIPTHRPHIPPGVSREFDRHIPEPVKGGLDPKLLDAQQFRSLIWLWRQREYPAGPSAYPGARRPG